MDMRVEDPVTVFTLGLCSTCRVYGLQWSLISGEEESLVVTAYRTQYTPCSLDTRSWILERKADRGRNALWLGKGENRLGIEWLSTFISTLSRARAARKWVHCRNWIFERVRHIEGTCRKCIVLEHFLFLFISARDQDGHWTRDPEKSGNDRVELCESCLAIRMVCVCVCAQRAAQVVRRKLQLRRIIRKHGMKTQKELVKYNISV